MVGNRGLGRAGQHVFLSPCRAAADHGLVKPRDGGQRDRGLDQSDDLTEQGRAAAQHAMHKPN